MSTLIARALIACASVACALPFSQSATAQQLRQHPLVQQMRPTQFDIEPVPDFIDEPNFGTAVAIRNGLAFVGIPGIRSGQGGVRIFTQNATGAWISTGTLTVSGSGGLGSTLTFRDGTLVAGGGKAAYVFRRVNGVWTLKQKLTAPTADNVDSFADSLRYEGGILAVSANASTRFSSEKPGVVYIFEADATGKLIRRAKLTGSHWPQERFGVDISMAGPVVVIGSPGDPGAAYIFKRNSTGTWRLHQKLVSPNGVGDGFGAAVAIDRAMILVGAPFARNNDFPVDGLGCFGAAYGFVPSAGRWFSTFELQPRSGDVELCEKFGSRIAMFDKHIAIASSEFEITSEGDVPSGTFVFTYTRTDWTVAPRGLTAQSVVFGVRNLSMSLANNWLLVGLRCHRDTFCTGLTDLYDINRFVQ